MNKLQALALVAAGIGIGAAPQLATPRPGAPYVHAIDIARLPVPGGHAFATSSIYGATFEQLPDGGLRAHELGSRRYDLPAEDAACISKALDRAAGAF